jgi:hypothetical protein
MATTAIGKELSERSPTDAEIDRWANEVAAMIGGYLAQLRRRR